MALRLSTEEIRLREGRPERVRVHSDAHEVLGVPATASRGQAAGAYRKAALRHHPDRNPADAAAGERFRRLRSAYEEAIGPPAISVTPRAGSAWRVAGVHDVDEVGTVGEIAFEVVDGDGRDRGVPDEVTVLVGDTELPLLVHVLASRRQALVAEFNRRAERAVLVTVCAVLLPVAALGTILLVGLVTGSVLVADVLLLLTAAAALALAAVTLRRRSARRRVRP